MKKSFFFFATICVFTGLKSQPVNNYLHNVIMPSPTAASMGKYTDIPVSYYTGVPNISLPIYTLTEGPLSIPISLSYHASGVKVGEAPSWVGQNWNLNAGGMISRTVQSLKDEDNPNGWLFAAPIPQPPTYGTNGFPTSGDFCGYVEHYASHTDDSEPDIFSFNFPGGSGKFYFKKDSSIVLVPVQDIRIVPSFSSNSSDIKHLKGFTITTPDGTKYLFGDNGDGNPAIETNIGDGGNYPEIPSGWYLKKMESADAKFSISFNYVGDYSSSDFQPMRVSSCLTSGPGGMNIPNTAVSTTFIKGHRISTISTSTETVTFTPGTAREDLAVYPVQPYQSDPPKVLASITVSATPFQKKFDFSYDYWVDNSTDQVTVFSTTLNKRLRLLSVQEKSVDGSVLNPAWVFEYFAKSGSPNFMPHRISRAIDHWGFFNEKNNGAHSIITPNTPGNLVGVCLDGQSCNNQMRVSGNGSDRNTNEAPMKYGTLKKITYPIGGYAEFDFEANDYYTTALPNDTINLVQIDGAYSSGGFTCGNADFYPSPQVYSFSQSTLNTSRYEWKLKPNTTNCQCVDGATSMRIKVYNAGTGVLYSQSAVINISCSPTSGSSGAGFLSSFLTPALQPDVAYKFEMSVVQGGADFKIRLPIVNASGNAKVGGLRVKQIKMHDGISAANDIIRSYEYRDSTITSKSSGVLYGAPNYVWNYSWFPCRPCNALCGSVCSPPNNPNDCNSPRVQCQIYELPSGGCNSVFFEQSITPLSTFEGYHIGYYYVKENFNGNGSKSYTYYTEISSDPPQFPTPPTQARILAGNLRYSTTRNSGGTVLATESHIPFNDAYTESTEIMYKRYEGPCGSFVTSYKIRTRPFREANITNVLDGVSTTTVYGYDSQNRHLQKVTEDVTDADGTVYRAKYKYPLEYPCPSGNNCDENNGVNAEAKAIYAMRKRYMIAIPIEQTMWLKRPGWGSHRLSGASYFQYDKVSTSYDNLKVKTVQHVKPASPLTSFTESSVTIGSFSKSSSYATEFNFVFSDIHGQLLSQWKQNNPAKEQYIWSHKNKLPIAKVVNAEDTEVAFTSFEQSDNAFQGNWNFPGAGGGYDTTAGNFLTGRVGFNLSEVRTITRNSLPAGKYLVSAWHKDGTFKVNGATVSTSSGGQWKYAEKEVTLATPGNITVSSGTGDWGQFIDELRLCPSDALMLTFSFDDRVLLMLSTADENSVPTHYDFEVLQRLQAMRDQDRNITQTFEYNYHGTGSVINNIKARAVLVTGQTTIAQVNALTGSNVRRVFQYMDGLGRLIQSNEVAQSPTANDIITHQAYDIQNREQKKYIPYSFTSNGGAYRSSAASEQLSFANTWGAGGYGYSEAKFEISPLNRPFELGSPGDPFRIGNGHTVEYLYRGNTSGDAVRDFTNNNSFVANLLRVTQETDENERKKWTFIDKLGRVVMVKQELNATETAQTYTVYDDFGRVLCVLPPETTKRMISSGNWDYNHASYASMIFKYAYDSRGRMTSKTVPSGGTTSIAYDRLDRPVLSTDAKSFKVFTRYDILSRPVVSGKYKGAGSPGAADPLFETSNTTAPHYYTSTSFPTDNNLDVYKVFYYDDYDLDNNGSLGATETYTNPAESGYDATAFLRTRGKPTASKVGILLSSGLAPTNFLTTRTYYDKEYSVIQVNKQNHLGGADISSSAYDFANRVTKTRRDHTATPPGGSLKTYYIREEYTYDAASRLRFTRHHISTTAGVPTAGWVVTAAPVYDELGRLLDKRLHASNYDGISPVTLNSSFTYLQSMDYTYNIRGWLTGINDPTICTAQSGDDAIDLFRMSLEYESTANGGTAQYNGNISTIQWNTYINGTCGTRHLYRFGYDFSNRLTAANYRARVGTTWVDQSKYTENNITYDFNGNLKTYFRRGHTGGSLIDNLTYTYGDAARPDRLTNMLDAGDAAKGFKYTAGAADYQYDLNGNMTQDNHKGFTFAYNYLNLPQTMTQGANVITLTYTADGEKLTKALSGGGATKSYVSGIEYSGTSLEAIYFSEGRCTPNGASAFYYDYTIKDHLGNARENFRASGGTAITHLEDMHYYPFGMLMEGMGTNSPTNDYAYNGKELNEDFGLNLSDYGARWYDASLGRWWSLDPMGEKYYSLSSFSYTNNNPLRYIDFFGMAIINGYQVTRDAAQQRLDKAQKKSSEYEGGEKSEIKKLQKEERRAQRSYDRINAKYESVENTITDLKKYNTKEYEALDNLTDEAGHAVDVYIEEPDHLTDKLGRTLSGKADVDRDQEMTVQAYGSTEVKTVATVKSKNGPNTATILINTNDPSKGETLAHEGGHVLHNVPNMQTYLNWRQRNPNEDGHAKGDPSGERAYHEQDIYNKNKKNK
jgi:RHS repeat-associated protein